MTRVNSDVVRVLVAEDDGTLGEVLARGLSSRGYVVDLVGDGETALSYTRCYDYAVAVLDWLMPGVSGIDVVRQLRRRGTQTPVLMTTWSSRSTSPSCSPGCARCSGARRTCSSPGWWSATWSATRPHAKSGSVTAARR